MRKKIFSVAFKNNNDEYQRVHIGALNHSDAVYIAMNRFNIFKTQIMMVSWSATKETV